MLRAPRILVPLSNFRGLLFHRAPKIFASTMAKTGRHKKTSRISIILNLSQNELLLPLLRCQCLPKLCLAMIAAGLLRV